VVWCFLAWSLSGLVWSGLVWSRLLVGRLEYKSSGCTGKLLFFVVCDCVWYGMVWSWFCSYNNVLAAQAQVANCCGLVFARFVLIFVWSRVVCEVIFVWSWSWSGLGLVWSWSGLVRVRPHKKRLRRPGCCLLWSGVCLCWSGLVWSGLAVGRLKKHTRSSRPRC
jgi:hypothetical protein